MMIFAGAALLLAALGLYGVVSYAVILRTPEIGIRMALGADRYSILRLIVGQGLRLVLIGTAAGLLAAVGVERAARNLLFETSASDPVVFAAVAVVFVAVGTIAAYVPARRALRVNPLTTLQSE
jgi:ABC-type antimicrobial peptide transport system permease subunit